MKKLPAKVCNLSGKTFGRLKVEEFVQLSKDGAVWRCLCECGNTSHVKAGDLKSGNTKSCGCQRADRASQLNTKHGVTKGLKRNEYPKTYKIWRGILNRCYTKSSSTFANYGGRGIEVCQEWRDSYEVFLCDMGECPDGYSIERIDVNGNYEPSNCKWIKLEEQVKNRRNTILVVLDGEEMIQAEAARRIGVRSAVLNAWRKGKQKKPENVKLTFLTR